MSSLTIEPISSDSYSIISASCKVLAAETDLYATQHQKLIICHASDQGQYALWLHDSAYANIQTGFCESNEFYAHVPCSCAYAIELGTAACTLS